MHFPPSELILNPDGSIYHLNLHEEQVAETIITVGDPDRVAVVSQMFDEVEVKVQKREFVTHTGRIGKKRLTVISTGIGTDNIDIVINELDAIKNIDLEKRELKNEFQALNFIRLGTSGALQKDIPVDTTLISTGAIGIDGLMDFYRYTNNGFEFEFLSSLKAHLNDNGIDINLYYFESNKDLQDQLISIDGSVTGNTITCPGFYGPQGRSLRIKLAYEQLNDTWRTFTFKGKRLDNFEMESSSIFGLSKILGHKAIAVNSIIANRETQQFSSNPKETVKKMVSDVLETIVSSEYF